MQNLSDTDGKSWKFQPNTAMKVEIFLNKCIPAISNDYRHKSMYRMEPFLGNKCRSSFGLQFPQISDNNKPLEV